MRHDEKPGTEKPERTGRRSRDDLLELAVDLGNQTTSSTPVRQHAVSHVSLSAVADAAGVTRGALYRLWPTQQDFWNDLAEVIAAGYLSDAADPHGIPASQEPGGWAWEDANRCDWHITDTAQELMLLERSTLIQVGVLGYPDPSRDDAVASRPRASRIERIGKHLDLELCAANSACLDGMTGTDLATAAAVIGHGVPVTGRLTQRWELTVRGPDPGSAGSLLRLLLAGVRRELTRPRTSALSTETQERDHDLELRHHRAFELTHDRTGARSHGQPVERGRPGRNGRLGENGHLDVNGRHNGATRNGAVTRMQGAGGRFGVNPMAEATPSPFATSHHTEAADTWNSDADTRADGDVDTVGEAARHPTGRRYDYLTIGADLATDAMAASDGLDRALGHVTLDSLARAAGVTRRTLTNVWPDQAAFRLDLLSYLLTRERQWIADAIAGATGANERERSPSAFAAFLQIGDALHHSIASHRAGVSFLAFIPLLTARPVAERALNDHDAIVDDLARHVVQLLGVVRRVPRPGVTLRQIALALCTVADGTNRLMRSSHPGVQAEIPHDGAPNTLTGLLTAAVLTHMTEPIGTTQLSATGLAALLAT